jgi:hypothetical protein
MTKGINSKLKPIQLDERTSVPYLLGGDSKIKLTLITSHLVYPAYCLLNTCKSRIIKIALSHGVLLITRDKALL